MSTIRSASALLSFSLVVALGAAASAQSRTTAQPVAERVAPAATDRAPARTAPAEAPTCPARFSVSEFVEALTESAERSGQDAPSREDLTTCFERLDSNGDGAVDTRERAAAAEGDRRVDPDTCVLTTNVCHL
jgi:hypothetical protein